MDKVELDGVYKEHIFKYLKENIRAYGGHEKQIENFEQTGILDKNIATTILGNLICSSKVTRMYLAEYAPREEFESQMLNANRIFDGIPKGKDYEEDTYSMSMDTAIYDTMDLDTIREYLQTGIRLDEFYKKVLSVQELRKVATTTTESIRSIENNEAQIYDQNKIKMTNIHEDLTKLLKQPNTDVQKIQMCIEAYNKEAVEIWKTYLNNGNGLLVHNITKGSFEGDFKTPYMSTSLITNKTMSLFGERQGNNYGLIIKPKNIINASEKDTWTNNGPVNYYEKIFLKTPAIKLPWEIEKSCIDRTIKESGEMLNYDNGPCFSEIVVDEYDLEAMYYRSNGEGELAPNYDIAKKMADERGVELIELDISKAREQQGLEPMTEGMQRQFFTNILRKQFLSEEQSRKIPIRIGDRDYSSKEKEITDNLYKNFYNKYLELRSNGKYGKEDILEAFRSIISEREMLKAKDYYDTKVIRDTIGYTSELAEDDKGLIENKNLLTEQFDESVKESDEQLEKVAVVKNIFNRIKSLFLPKSKMLPEAEEKISKKAEDKEIKSWDLVNWGIDKQEFMVEHAEYIERYSERQQNQPTMEQPSIEQSLGETELTIHSGHEL